MMTNEGRPTQLWERGAECTLHLLPTCFWTISTPLGILKRDPAHKKLNRVIAPASECILVWAELWKGWAGASFPGCLVWKRGYQPTGNWTVRVSSWGREKVDNDCTCLTNCYNHIIVHTSFLHSKPLYSRGFQIPQWEHSSVAWALGFKICIPELEPTWGWGNFFATVGLGGLCQHNFGNNGYQKALSIMRE